MQDARILPDGSAVALVSYPLPKDHWLYAPRGEWDNERDDFAELPRPILNNSHRAAVTAAIRYAIRGATMCGQDPDFDPDALVQNACYALCGPANGAVLPCDAPPTSADAAVVSAQHGASDNSEQDQPSRCEFADDPRGCYRVRCQLGKKCVGEKEEKDRP